MHVALTSISHACYLKVTILLWVPMFDIFVDWPKNAKLLPANINYTHYRTLECVDPVPLSHTNRKI